ncbi:pentapeptide repeat-containing protein, partial [Microcystis aeruginosa]|uniref:pentapeptide repeat-containing protein n=1 Tax=Microcystis aeruginosa TaxID=1126 RepID=UPI000677F84A
MVPKKSPRIPLELHQIKAHEFYQKRLASGKEGSEIDDWQQAKEYFSQHPRAILAWNLKMPYRRGKRLIKRLLLSLQSLVRVAWKLLIFPFWLFQQIPGLFAREDKDSRTFAIDVVKTIISALGLIATLFAGIGLFVNYLNSQAEIQLTQQRLITERFSKAVEQIGNPKEEVVIGGIYSLERIAKDSPKDQWTIMEVLTSYIRKNSPISSNIQQLKPEEREKALEKLPSVSIPVQAALTVIGRRKVENDQAGANLTGTIDLYKISVYRIEALFDLSRTNLRGANLNGANLIAANLIAANLIAANLNGAEDLHPEQIKSACFWEKAIHTQAMWDGDKQLWVAEDWKANQREIEKLKRDKNSDPRNPLNCN